MKFRRVEASPLFPYPRAKNTFFLLPRPGDVAGNKLNLPILNDQKEEGLRDGAEDSQTQKVGYAYSCAREQEHLSFLTGHLNPCHASLSRITGMKCKLAANAHAIFHIFSIHLVSPGERTHRN